MRSHATFSPVAPERKRCADLSGAGWGCIAAQKVLNAIPYRVCALAFVWLVETMSMQ